MDAKEKIMLAKMDAKLDGIDKKLDGHLSEHFKIRLVVYTILGTLAISLLL